MPIPRLRPYSGPALFSYGFRPFFLAAGAWAACGVLLWLPQYIGDLSLPTAFGPLDWHIHEMLYGYVAAAVAGFLLTAIPNWTGRLPVNGYPLAALAGLWLLGRVAIVTSALIGLRAAALIDVAFLVTLGVVAVREIVAGKNWRNLRVLGALGVLIAGNVVFHVEVMIKGSADYGVRIGVAAVIGLIMLIGGRIVPSFTRNWLARQAPGRLPAPFSRFDLLVLATSAAGLLTWIASPDSQATGSLLLAAGVLQVLRLGRWAGERTVSDRLVLILHAAYAFVPLGFLLAGGAALMPARMPLSAAIHAWTAGAAGLMTLAVMTRATLGHTGHALIASRTTQTIYALALVAAGLRVIAAFYPSMALIDAAGVSWMLAFGGFVAVYGPLLVRPRLA